MFDFPHFLGGVIMFVAKHFKRIKIRSFLAKPKYTYEPVSRDLESWIFF